MKQETVFLTYDQSLDLVNRIAERAKRFSHEMIEAEKEAMAQLLSEIGVKVSDLIDVSYLADNYAINAEIVTPDDYDNYDMREVRQDSLFQWVDEHNGENETFYCLTW